MPRDIGNFFDMRIEPNCQTENDYSREFFTLKKTLHRVKLSLTKSVNRRAGSFQLILTALLASVNERSRAVEIHSSICNLKMVIYIIIHRPTDFCYIGQTSHKLKKRIVQHLRGKKQFVDKIIRIEREHYWIVYFKCRYPRGFNMTDGGEDNGKNNGCNKPVICLDTGEKFNSAIEVAEHFDICPSGISGVCHGRKKTVGRLRFAFADSKIDFGEPFLVKTNGKPCRVTCIDTGETFDSIVSAAKKI